MCGPYGHGYLTDDNSPSGPLAPNRGAVGRLWDRIKGFVLPSGRMLIPGYAELNAHHEIRQRLGLRTSEVGLIACGIDLPSGHLLIQRRSEGKTTLTDADVQAVEKHWSSTIKGKFVDFFVQHAGRLDDLIEWQHIFHRLLSMEYVLHRLRHNKLQAERYCYLVNHEIAKTAVEGIRLTDSSLTFHSCFSNNAYPYTLAVEDLPPAVLKMRTRLALSLWGRSKDTATRLLTKYPNEYVSGLL